MCCCFLYRQNIHFNTLHFEQLGRAFAQAVGDLLAPDKVVAKVAHDDVKAFISLGFESKKAS